MLMGRNTYEMFAAAWPVSTGDYADRMNKITKEDLHQLDLRVAEHRGLTAAIGAVDAALASGVGVTTAPRSSARSSATISIMRSSRSSRCWSGIWPGVSGDGSCSPSGDGARLGNGPSS
jgi:hypothetical protein